jgi:hypothetical protein
MNTIKLTEEHITIHEGTNNNDEKGNGSKKNEKNEKKEKKEKKEIEKPTCIICAENYNNSFHKPIKCEYCDFEACKKCCQTYLINENDPKCMSNECNRQWTHQFISNHFSKTFINNDLKLHYEKILFDKQRALMPSTQPLVENILRREEYQRKINAAYNVVREAKNNLNAVQIEYNIFVRSGHTNENTRSVFIRACPDSECRGFLSSQWKCGICSKWTCPTCHEVKGMERDVEHTCNPDNVATANLLNSDTKPCPKCGEGIFKIDGCFAANTPILMWDGSIKMSQNIALGDILVGDDGTQRTVLRLMEGEDDMYEVQQNNGMNYTVNSKHTLALKHSGNKGIYWLEKGKYWNVIWFDKENYKIKSKSFKIDENCNKEETKIIADKFISELYQDDTIEIKVDEYLKLNDSIKKYLMGFKGGFIDYPSQPVELDPYMLGLWLGDGTHCSPNIASNDKEIVDYMIEWCNKNDAELMKVKNNNYLYRIRRKGYSLNCNTINADENCDTTDVKFPDSENRTNPFTNLLNKYNLIRNKHIPKEYLMNDRSVRLQLLAGIIDTDGHVTKEQKGKRVTIIQTRVELSEQIIFLAKSLGFTVNYTMRERKNVIIFNSEPKDYKNQYNINISGEKLYEIPTIIPRKKCAGSCKNLLNTSINVVYKEKGKYYGWEIDKNHRFLLADTTHSMNCDQIWCLTCHTAFSWRTGRIENVIHNPHYYEWMRRNGTLQRDPNDIVCGREITHNTTINIRRHLTEKETILKKDAANIRKLSTYIIDICRKVVHIRHVSQPHYHYNSDDIIQQLRIRYLRNFISEDDFKIALQRENKKSNKYREISEVITLLITTITDIIMNFIDEINTIEWKYNLERMKEIEQIIDYADECFLKISRTYSSVPLTFEKL